MTSYINVRRDLEPHLPATPTTATAIARRVGTWAPHSIRCALNELADAGVIHRSSEPNQCGQSRNLYWRDA